MIKNKIIAGVAALSIGVASLSTVALANEGNNKHNDLAFKHKTTVNVPVVSQIGLTLSNNGTIHVRGLKVLSISGNVITGQVSYGTNVLNVTVNTASTTKITHKSTGVVTIGSVKVGDYLRVDGDLTISGNSFTITAKKISDRS